MRYISKEELQSLPSYPYMEQAINFPHNPNQKCSPWTRDGNLSVAAIYNMSRWSSWKSSSLSDHERGVADEIGGLRLGSLMTLNQGRRMNQPALFPEGDILPEGQEDIKYD